MIHKLKIEPIYFDAIRRGDKTFEVRYNDRNFKNNDELLLEEYIPENYYQDDKPAELTGRIIHRQICYVLSGGKFGIEKGFVVLGLQKI
jgi:Domain of unknown function (DUF3850)